jgi:ribosomal-protein-alanine N-acetyltransferase
MANTNRSVEASPVNAGKVPVWSAGDWPRADASARVAPGVDRRVAFEPVTAADLDAVCEVEKSAYTHPWTHKHFADSLASGYPVVMLLGEALPGEAVHPRRTDGRVLLGYLVAMPGVDEVHLLNITVAPAHQRQGWARFLLDALALWSRSQGAQWLWLEVRASNAPARALYESHGFRQVGMRRGYYPAGQFQREDAVVMSLNLVARASGGGAA